MNTIVKPIPHTVDLNEPVKKTYIDTLLATEDNLAHRFDITIKKGGEAVTLPDGAAVTAYFIRYGDNATVPITGGAVNGNVASVTLTQACYNKPGQFAIIIKVSGEGVIHTVFYGEGTVFASSTDKIVDEENVIPSLADLLARIAEMEAGTAAANTATNRANAAANHCEQMQIDASGMAGDSNKLGGKAPEYYLQPRNLLDNSNFQDIDEIINQRGYVSGTNGTSNYCIDRWKLQYNTALQLNSGYVTLTGAYDICQIVSQKLKAGVTYTLAARMRASGGTRTLWLIADDSAGNRIIDDGTQNSGEWVVLSCLITPNADMSDVSVYITNSGDANVHTDIAWVALHEGNYTAETLPPYVPKGYAAELAECQRYYYRIGFRTLHPAYLKFNGSTAAISVYTPLPMRSDAPTFVGDASQLRVYGNGTVYSGFQVYACVNDGSACVLEVNTSNTLPTGQSYFARFDSDGEYAISADL